MLLLCLKTQQWQCLYEIKVKFFAVSVLQGPTWQVPFPLWHQLSPPSLPLPVTSGALLSSDAPGLEAGFSVSSGSSPWVLLPHMPTNYVIFFLSPTTRGCSLSTSSVPVHASSPALNLRRQLRFLFFCQYLSPSYILYNLLTFVYICLPLECYLGFPGGAVVKNLPASAGDSRDASSIPGSGSSPGVGNGNPLQYPCLENSMDRGAWGATVHGVTKSWTWLSDYHTHNVI